MDVAVPQLREQILDFSYSLTAQSDQSKPDLAGFGKNMHINSI